MIMSFTPGDHIFKSLHSLIQKFSSQLFPVVEEKPFFLVKMNNADVVTLQLVFVALSYAARGSTWVLNTLWRHFYGL